jgi:hypothetical protein
MLHSIVGIDKFPKLVELKISQNPQLTEGLSELASLRSLDILDISGCDGVVEESINVLSLSYLAMSKRSRPNIARTVAGMRSLRFLDLSNGSLDDEAVQAIAKLTNLEYLDLSYCSQLPDMAPLRNLTKLRVFKATETNLSNLDFLSGADQIMFVGVSKCSSLRSIDGIRHASQLAGIDAGDTPALRSLGPVAKGNRLEEFAKASPEFLGLQVNDKVGDRMIARIASQGDGQVTEEALKAMTGWSYSWQHGWRDLLGASFVATQENQRLMLSAAAAVAIPALIGGMGFVMKAAWDSNNTWLFGIAVFASILLLLANWWREVLSKAGVGK